MTKDYRDGIRLGIIVGMSVGIILGMEILLVQGYIPYYDHNSDDMRSDQFTSIDTLDGLYKSVPLLDVRESPFHYLDPE
jgi:hypothetical protein